MNHLDLLKHLGDQLMCWYIARWGYLEVQLLF